MSLSLGRLDLDDSEEYLAKQFSAGLMAYPYSKDYTVENEDGSTQTNTAEFTMVTCWVK